jgi:DNA-binding NtrC family response regulator
MALTRLCPLDFSRRQYMVLLLVVNDDPQVRNMIREVMELEGHSVLTANDGQDGLELMRTSPEALVVLVDFLMEHMSGPNMMLAVGEDVDLAARHVYILHGWYDGWYYATPEKVRNAMKYPPAHPVLELSQPFTVDQMLAVIENAAQYLGASQAT